MEPRGHAELFDLLVKNANGLAIFTLDADRRVASWNESAEKLLGYKEQEILGQSVDVFFTAADRANNEPEKEFKIATEVGQASDDRWIVRKDQSRFWCGGLTIALKDRELHGFGKVMRDQTDMKEALDEVTRLNQKLHETITTAESEPKQPAREGTGPGKVRRRGRRPGTGDDGDHAPTSRHTEEARAGRRKDVDRPQEGPP